MWNPEESSLKGLVDLLNETQVPNNIRQKEIAKEINNLAANSEFYNYLVYILCLNDGPSFMKTRSIAGATLKGMLERNYKQIAPENLNFVKTKLIEAFHDDSVLIRNAAVNAMTALFVKLGFQQWPELFQFLAMNLNADNAELVKVSLECITKILEDLENDSENVNYFEEKNNSPLTELIPKLIFMCDLKYPVSIREYALKSLNIFTSMMPPSFILHMNSYFQVLFLSASDQQNPIIRQLSCEGFVGVLEKRKDLITANLENVLETIVKFTIDSNSDVKKEACLFWNEFLIAEEDEPDDRFETLRKILGYLLPALIDCLPYTEEDMLELENEYAKETSNPFANTDDEEEGIKVIQDDDDDINVSRSTLRREAGVVIEMLARRFEGDAFYQAQAKLEECLKNDNWLIKESGILCLGSLGKGASEAISKHFGNLFPFLLQSLENPEGLLRCIACWTLSRFTSWIVKQDENTMKIYLTAVLKLMMDDSKKVQEASCSALSKLCNDGPETIQAYIKDVIDVIKLVSTKYNKKGTIKYLYDAIGSLAYNISEEVIQSEEVERVLMQDVIVQKWSESHFNDVEATVLVEVTDSLISALDKNASKYAAFFVERILYLINYYIEGRKADDRKDLFHKREVAIRCIDLLDTFLGILNNEALQVLSPESYFNIFHECAEDQDILLRQIILSSAKQVSKTCPALFNNYLEQVAEALIKNLIYAPQEIDSQGLYMGCCNNASATVGEFAIVYGEHFHKYIPDFAKKICEIFTTATKLHKGVAQTLAIALGRLGFAYPEGVAPLLGSFLKRFCIVIESFTAEEIEKEQAFMGVFKVILKNPEAALTDFIYLCFTVVNFDKVSVELGQMANEILHEFKNFAGNQWPAYYEKFPPPVKKALQEKFGI